MKIFLYPLAGLYWLITFFRNKFFDWGYLRSKKYKAPIIAVGNLSVGGTGKSPVVIYLCNILEKYGLIGVVSRGYGRLTQGYHFANYNTTYQDIGDEPTQIFERFRNKIVVGVAEKRTEAIDNLIHDFHPRFFVLDDAFQHRYVNASHYILLTDYNKRYSSDKILPLGRLREGKYGAKRADIVIVTKCPEFPSEEEKNNIKIELKIQAYQHLFFSKIVYNPKIFSTYYRLQISELADYNILLITGIAKHEEILAFSQEKFATVTHLKFNDHHSYNTSDLENIETEYDKIPEKKLILTTEKDYMRLKLYNQLKHDLFYLPIDLEIDRPEEFKNLIVKYATKN